MSRVRALALPLIATSLVLAACGGDDDETTTTTAAAVTTEAATETTAAVETTAVVETTEAAVETTAVVETTEAAPETTEAALGSIVDVLAAKGNFTTLLGAVEAAGLTDTLAGGQFTLLAPTDEAFAKVDPAALAALTADPAALATVLQGHLIGIAQESSNIGIFSNLITVAGTSIPVTNDGTTITVGGAAITEADVPADNGFIQVIDTVILPAA
jgi:transforming growth factor-beta-induced protein